jgi:lipopolysaccharide/colanic/teichoic acid biosynthesis glycosyltransferase
VNTSRPAARGLPRAAETGLAGLGLLLSSPLLLPAALAVKLGSPGPVLFRQQRVGQGGQPFTLLKLRTMRGGGDGPAITRGGDPRVTAIGRLLRRFKLDELPQLWNVVRGDMALVGPRPEVPRYVDLDDPSWQRVLSVRPGLTDPVTLELRNEEALLAEVDGDAEEFYIARLLPFKVKLYVQYLEGRSGWSDVMVLLRTAVSVFLPKPPTTKTWQEILSQASDD